MKTPRQLLLILISALVCMHSISAQSEIKLTGRKDLVLSYDSRQTVLEVARKHLSEKSGAFLGQLKSIDTPYAFDVPVVAVERSVGAGVTEQPEVATINYDDASVLKVVAQNFATQVRGTLARGSTSFLQLKGGSMVKPGTSFPVSIPQAQGKSFTVTISEITSNGYTLELGEAKQVVSLDGSVSPSSGSIKLD